MLIIFVPYLFQGKLKIFDKLCSFQAAACAVFKRYLQQ